MRPGSDSMFCAPWKVTDLFPKESQIHHPETTCSWWYRHTILSLQKVPGFGGCLQNESSNELREQSMSLQELVPGERVSTGLIASNIVLDPGSFLSQRSREKYTPGPLTTCCLLCPSSELRKFLRAGCHPKLQVHHTSCISCVFLLP